MDTCSVVGKIEDGSGNAVYGMYVHAIPYLSPAIVQGTSTGLSTDTITVLTSSTGTFELELAQNVEFTIHIPEMGFKKTVKIPDNAGPVLLWSLTDIFITGDSTPDDQGEDTW